MTRTCLSVFLGFLLILALLVPLSAAEINSGFQSKIDSGPDKYYSAYVMMRDMSTEVTLSRALSLDLYTRQAGHAIAVKHLQEIARESQASLLEYLQAQLALGTVTSFRGYWIDNIVAVTASGRLIEEISRRDDVRAIHEIQMPMLIEPEESPETITTVSAELPDALTVIGADSMWALGYTGTGSLVCSFDTGIDGEHPALRDTWRGNNGYSWQESWFDPIEGDSVPHVVQSSTNKPHGTHTMGIMVGHDDATGDTVGVAPNAQWISAAIIDIPGARILDAFEWAADPDGNPNTVNDVPDVVSHSWGYPNTYSGCEDVFWGAIDNLEALGAACVFAAGNDGNLGSETIRNPANRATTPYNSFAVGNVVQSDPGLPIYYRSSRGPSDCDGVSLKPQVSAPGSNIRSTIPVVNGSYGFNTGTSMSCPHVAGAIALLRQYNPNAPVDSIKKALMESAIDIEDPGPDMKSGYGLIYIPAAIEILAPNDAPNLFVSNISYEEPEPGDTIYITLSIGNSGLGLNDVEATLRSGQQEAEVIDSFFAFGSIPLNGEADNEGSPLSIAFDADITAGTDISLTLHVTGSDSYVKDIPFVFSVGEKAARATAVHDVGNCEFALSNFGHYGFAEWSIYSLDLPGFVWPAGGENNLFEMGLLIGVDSTHVSDNVRNAIHEPDFDFEVSPGGDLQWLEPGADADQESFCIFDDSKAERPIGVRVSQRTLAFSDPSNDDYIMLIYEIENTTDAALEGLVAAIATDWDWPFDPTYGGSRDRVDYDSSSNLGYMYDDANPDYRGITVLNDEGVSAFRAVKNSDYIWDTDGGTDPEKWEFMTGGIISESTYGFYPDHQIMMATGPFDIAPGFSVRSGFVILAADSLDDLREMADSARAMYDDIYGSISDTDPPTFTINLLPNTVLDFELDLIAFPSEPLALQPEAIFSVGADIDTITMTLLSDRDAVTYVADYNIEQAGSYDLSVCGFDTVYNSGCSDVSFSAAPVKASEGVLLTSYSEFYEMLIQPHSLSRDALVICNEIPASHAATSGIDIPDDFECISAVRIRSGSLRSNARLTVHLDRIGLDADQAGSAILLRSAADGSTETIESEIDLDEMELIADIDQFGIYLVGLSSDTDGADEPGVIRPNDYRISQNWPNPFNTGTTISYDLPEPTHVELVIYNILGQRVITLVDRYMRAGTHTAFWDGTNRDGDHCSTGIYFYKINAGTFRDIRRMLLLK